MERRGEFAAANLQAESYLGREHNARWAALRVAHATSGITANRKLARSSVRGNIDLTLKWCVRAAPEVPPASSTMPLVDVVNIVGVPPGVSPADVGKAMTFSISEAARIMGFPPGISPTDVGKTITMPLPMGLVSTRSGASLVRVTVIPLSSRLRTD